MYDKTYNGGNDMGENLQWFFSTIADLQGGDLQLGECLQYDTGSWSIFLYENENNSPPYLHDKYSMRASDFDFDTPRVELPYIHYNGRL